MPERAARWARALAWGGIALALAAPLAGCERASASRTTTAAPPSPSAAPAAAAPADGDADRALRSWLGRHLGDQLGAVTTALVAVDEKLVEARRIQGQRAKMAYRVLQHRQAADPVAVAGAGQAAVRGRAAVAWLLARDREEVVQLLDEQALLVASQQRLEAAAASLPALPLPPRALPWPAEGSTIARGFGPFAHERSGTTLSRRGLDLEVAERAAARALAAGTIVFAGPVRGLDLGVLVDHGGYWTFLGKLETLEVAAGQRVAAEQPLGRAARRRLYLELRLKLLPGGVPVDPAPFLAARD